MIWFKILFVIFYIFQLNNVRGEFVISIVTNGSYSLEVNKQTWMQSSPRVLLKSNGTVYSSSDDGLFLNGTFSRSGQDVIGRWQSITFNYVVANDTNTTMECSIINYLDYDIIRFKQFFPNGANGTGSVNFDSVLSTFPSFNVGSPDNLEIGFLSFGGMMAGDMEKTYGRWDAQSSSINGGLSGGPLVLFNAKGDTLVIAPMTQFMAASMQRDQFAGGFFDFGIMSGVNSIPPNYSVEFVVSYSDKGINKAMEEWGNFMLKYYGKNLSIRDNDITANYLSYWTDNGAYYYWQTETGKNYEDTLFAIVNNSIQNNIPFRTLQYDSWWYGAEKGYRQGAFLWDGRLSTEKLPDSLVYVYEKTGLPVTAHNKFWDISVKYAKQNGGSYNFLLDALTAKSLPDDQTFWDDLFANATKWGLKTYEQDWLNHQTLDFTPLMTDISLGRRWLKQMGNAASKNNLTLQYCMSLSRHVLQSLEIDAVTQVRVTNDYATNWDYGGEQWRVGVSSLLSASLGLLPFKDVYWTTSVQPGNPYGTKDTDPNVELNSVVSILTAGPVGPGDRIGQYTNQTLIMRSCNDDGLLLKPSKPITAIDEQIYAKAFGDLYGPTGEVWSTYSIINNFTFGILLAADVKNTNYQITSKNIGVNVSNSSIFWRDGHLEELTVFSTSSPIKLTNKCTAKEFCLYYVNPLFSIQGKQVALLGELSKWVPVSPKRVQNIQLTATSMLVDLFGAINERITVSFLIMSSDSSSSVIRNTTAFFSTTHAQVELDLSNF